MRTLLVLALITLAVARIPEFETNSKDYEPDCYICPEMSQNQILGGWRAAIQTDEFRTDILTLLVRDQIIKAYGDRLLESMEQGLKVKAKSKLTEAVNSMKEDIRRQLVEAASKDLEGKVSSVTLNLNNHIRAEAKAFIADSETIRGFLQQHDAEVHLKMQKVLSDSKLELEGLYRDHLARIIQEDQYRTINAALVEDLKVKYAGEFAAIGRQYEATFNAMTASWKATIQKMIDDISAKTAQVSNTHAVLQRVDAGLSKTESYAKWAYGLSILAVGMITVRIVIGLTQ